MLIQGGSGRLRPRGSFAQPPGAVHEKQVLIAIAIEIEECDAATHGFREQFFALRTVVMDERNPGGFGNISELCFGHLRGRQLLRNWRNDLGDFCRRGGGFALEQEKNARTSRKEKEENEK